MTQIPATKKEFEQLRWDMADFIFITGDAYVDHPSFAHAIISRLLTDLGYKIAVIAMPDYKDIESIKIFGRPRYGFLVSSGNIDSMVNHYTVQRHKRKKDVYAPKGEAGLRPNRATIVYCNMILQAYKDTAIIIGGIEASLRRFAHYDYWDDKIRRSILEDSSADLLVYGMGEKAIVEIAALLKKNVPISSIKSVKGTCYLSNELKDDAKILPSFYEVSKNKRIFAQCFMMESKNQDHITGKVLVQRQHRKYVIQNPPAKPLTTAELDRLYELPYTRQCHRMYLPDGIEALKEVKFSLLSSRGCFGGCNFCALTYHQGRGVVSRSHESLIKEAKLLTKLPDFKGYIHDVGGPTANFRHPSCEKQLTEGVCSHKQCLYPEACSNLYVDHEDYISLLRKLRKIEGVKKVFIRSGLRYDYIMEDKNRDKFINELCLHHISGRLKIAPEHVSNRVLDAMGKMSKDYYFNFKELYEKTNKSLGKKQHIEAYFISSHPGSTINDAIELACVMRDENIEAIHVQDFYPTPSTISTCMYYTGIDPRNMKSIYVPKARDKVLQRALLQYRLPKNHALVIEALKKAGRQDLIGNAWRCLVKDIKR